MDGISDNDLRSLLFYTWAACGLNYRTVREILAKASISEQAREDILHRYRLEFPGRAGV